MLKPRSIGLARRSFHNALTRHAPPRRTGPSVSRWGQFERIVPASLAEVDVTSWPRRPVPASIPRPAYAAEGLSSEWGPGIPRLTRPDQVQGLREACQLAKQILSLGGPMCQPGTTTDEIDRVLHEAIVAKGAYPSPLNYMGYPKSVCTSVNNTMAHSIPDNRPLKDGDIINIDVTVYLNGYHGDTSATFLVGNVDQAGQMLVKRAKECLEKAIEVCRPGAPFSEIGDVINDHAEDHGYSVSEDLTGHGIGTEFHCNPVIHHSWNDEKGTMEPGMAFTIEPVLCQGLAFGIMWPDDWTISTIDGGRSAQFEHTVLITKDGVDVLTR